MEVLAIVLFSSSVVLLILHLRQRRITKKLRSELEPLLKYRGVVDAEALIAEVLERGHRKADEEIRGAQLEATRLTEHARRLVADAERATSEMRAKASTETNDLRQAADRVATETRARATAAANELRARAEQTMLGARAESARIIDAATKRAQEIAGDALLAVENARQYEQTAIAMKNVIEGYGDRYIIPSHSVLDDLAEEFGFAEAGQELKKARQRMRDMLKAGVAATCDYVEQIRRETAIRFVLDAFNGKVDSTLSKVKHDNVGTLRQEISDAFNLVNANGAAFRNARIEPEYRDARLDELRWAVVAQELKFKEKEEQRAIKERIREEEKAQREFERAMKEVAKEEEMLKKAMEKIQKQVAQATDAERAKYEAQLADLTARLVEAEAKAQRALSMAQQTKSGHVYVISNVGSFGEEVFKIGMTRRLEPQDRVRELGDASVPFAFDVHAMIHSDDAPALERDLHKRFVQAQVNKVNPRKEFFRVPLADIRSQVAQLGIKAKWTLTAEARHYRETLAIEEAMRKHEFDEGRWLDAQMKAADAMEMDEEEEAA